MKIVNFSSFLEIEKDVEFFEKLSLENKEIIYEELFEYFLDLDGIENIEYFLESKKNKPTNSKLWSQALNNARNKFTKYPSAYANLWACKWYKSKGGKWKKSVKENNLYIVENLKKWLKEKWVRINSSGKIVGACGTSKDKNNPDRCLPLNKAKSLSVSERKSTASKKKKGKKQFVPNTKKAKY